MRATSSSGIILWLIDVNEFYTVIEKLSNQNSIEMFGPFKMSQKF